MNTFELPLGDKKDLAAATPVPEPEYTPLQIGQMRRRYVTVTLGHVVTCNHPFWTDKQPARNCDDCWFAFFKVNPELIERIHNILRTSGAGVLMATMGRKFVKKFGKYLETVLHTEQEERQDGISEETEGGGDSLRETLSTPEHGGEIQVSPSLGQEAE
jgi:hypothetical protein